MLNLAGGAWDPAMWAATADILIVHSQSLKELFQFMDTAH